MCFIFGGFGASCFCHSLLGLHFSHSSPQLWPCRVAVWPLWILLSSVLPWMLGEAEKAVSTSCPLKEGRSYSVWDSDGELAFNRSPRFHSPGHKASLHSCTLSWLPQALGIWLPWFGSSVFLIKTQCGWEKSSTDGLSRSLVMRLCSVGSHKPGRNASVDWLQSPGVVGGAVSPSPQFMSKQDLEWDLIWKQGLCRFN
jgi:hypothetical protein